jgi:hypothetical protein
MRTESFAASARAPMFQETVHMTLASIGLTTPP